MGEPIQVPQGPAVPWAMLAPFAPVFAGSLDVDEQVDTHVMRIRQTISLAQAAVDKQLGHPFGAILVDKESGKVMLEATNTVFKDKDVTRHAELNLCSTASQQFTRKQLLDAILYTSTEPCAMCSGAIYWSGIRCAMLAPMRRTHLLTLQICCVRLP